MMSFCLRAAFSSRTLVCQRRRRDNGLLLWQRQGVVSLLNRRHSSTSKNKAPHGECVYVAEKSLSVKSVKVLSMTSSLAFTAAAPLLLQTESIAAMSLWAKASTVGFPMLFTYATSLMLHFISKAFVHKMYFARDEQVLTAELRSFFFRRVFVRFTIDDIPQGLIFDGSYCKFSVNNRTLFLVLKDITDKEVFTAFLDRT